MRHTLTKVATAGLLLAGSLVLCQCAGGPVADMNASGVNAKQLAANSRKALNDLYSTNPGARRLGASAKGILIFPEITKGGLMVGGMAGNGALMRNDGTIRDFYQTAGVSYGLQAGVQQYGL